MVKYCSIFIIMTVTALVISTTALALRVAINDHYSNVRMAAVIIHKTKVHIIEAHLPSSQGFFGLAKAAK